MKVKLFKNGTRQLIPFEDLRDGDTFTQYNKFGTPTLTNEGFTIFKAVSNPYINCEEVWQIDILETLTDKQGLEIK